MPPTRMLLSLMSLLILSSLAQATEESVRADPPATAPAQATEPTAGTLPSVAEIRAMSEDLARAHGLDPVLVHALIGVESGYDPRAVSPKGAVGLMQVMPETATDYGVTSVERLFDPEINLRTGMRHLKRLLGKYGAIGPAVMAYNAGEGALERSEGFVPYPETQRYTHRVLLDYLIQKGLRPYSPQARDHIGLDLRPEMAVAGTAGAVDLAMIRRLVNQGDWLLDADRAALAEPKPRPMPQSPQLLSSRLSSRLDTASNSLLQSRLMQPRRGPAGDASPRSPSRLVTRRP